MRLSLRSGWFRVTSRRGAPRSQRKLRRPLLEVLEDRCLLSTYHVVNANDSGPGSLRQAILDANASNTVSNRIDFSEDLTSPITLLTALPAIDNDVLLRAQDESHVTVQRSSAAGTPEFRIFKINAGRTVGLSGLTIANGLATKDFGGGILNQGTLTVQESVITGNTANRSVGFPGGEGGGIANFGTLTLRECSVTGNTAASSAGGLLNRATATLDEVSISHNAQTRGSAYLSIDGSAGGMVSDGPLTMRDSLVSQNSGGTGGLFVGASTGNVLISHSVIADNQFTPTGFGTAGIEIEGSNQLHVLIQDSLITRNNGGDQETGGLGIFGEAGGFQLVSSTIRENTGGNGGLSISNYGSTGQIIDSTISDNVGVFAGGVSGFGLLEVLRSTISGNRATPHGSFGVGGIFSLGGFKIDNSTISGNTVLADDLHSSPYGAAAAGGLLALNLPFTLPTTTIDHSTIAFNRVLHAPQGNFQISGGVTGASYTYYGTKYDADVRPRNTIIAKNEYNLTDPDVTGTFHSAGHNLLGVLGSSATGFVASDLHGTAAAPLDPRLGALRFNGGPTRTHALRRGSPAINAGDNANAPPTDQRGKTRIVGGIIDIGSYELQQDDEGEERDSARPSATPPSGVADATFVALAGALDRLFARASNVSASRIIIHPPLGGMIQEQTGLQSVVKDHSSIALSEVFVGLKPRTGPNDALFIDLGNPMVQAGLSS